MRKRLLTILALASLAAGFAHAEPCVEPDNGDGTIDLPPTCPAGYVGTMQITDGLPAGSTIEIEAAIVCSAGLEVPGGDLGGMQQTFDAVLQMHMLGTGGLDGFERFINVPVGGSITASAPRTPGDPVQDFDQQWDLLDGFLIGDPDFCTFHITGGDDMFLPSPGHTTLTDVGGGTFNVDSFFDIEYRITWQGCPGSVLDGMSGVDHATERFTLGEQPIATRATTWGAVKALYDTE